MKFIKYLELQFKRIRELTKKTLLISFCFSLIVFLILFLVTKKSSVSENQTKYCVGVVGSRENNLLAFGMMYLKNMDQLKNVLEIKEFKTEEAARKALDNDEIIAFAVIPREFTDDLYYLKNNSSVSYYTKEGIKGIGSVIMKEIADLAENLILSTQAGLFTLIDYMDGEGISYRMQNAHIEKIFERYIKLLINREKLTKIEETGSPRGVSLFTYYFIAFLLLYVILISFSGISFFTGLNGAFNKLVSLEGINSFKQVLCEALVYFLMNVLLFLVFFLFIAGGALFGVLEIKEFGENQFGGLMLFCIKFILVIMLFSFMQFFLFSLIETPLGKPGISFFVFLIFSFVSGYFYPKSFLPVPVMKAGNIIPTGTAFSYCVEIINHSLSVWTIFSLLFYSVLFLGLSAVIRERRKI